jgi:hypothetical protein
VLSIQHNSKDSKNNQENLEETTLCIIWQNLSKVADGKCNYFTQLEVLVIFANFCAYVGRNFPTSIIFLVNS